MNYSEEYALTHDIDVFCKYSGKSCHFASNGTLLATLFDVETNRECQINTFSENQTSMPIIPRFDLLNILIDHSIFMTNRITAIENYLSTFAQMAHNGFYSYDVLGEKDGVYYCVLIASPLEENRNFVETYLPELPIDKEVRLIENIADLRRWYENQEGKQERESE